MRQHWRRSSDKIRVQKTVAIVIGVLALGFILPRVFGVVGTLVLYPIDVAQTWLHESTMTLPVLWRDKITLQERVVSLEEDLARQVNPSMRLDRLLDENRHLRSLLHATSSERIAAVVVRRPTETPYDVLVLDQGSSAGVEVGAPVFSTADEVIGLVHKVTKQTAHVTLFTTPNFSTTAYLSDSNLLVTLEGVGGGVARIAVPQGIALEERMLVFLPSLESGVFGRVSVVKREPTDPQQYGYIVGNIPLQQLRFVSVGSTSGVLQDTNEIRANIDFLQESLVDITLASTSATTSLVEIGANENVTIQ